MNEGGKGERASKVIPEYNQHREFYNTAFKSRRSKWRGPESNGYLQLTIFHGEPVQSATRHVPVSNVRNNRIEQF
jgi:hypothetical protein